MAQALRLSRGQTLVDLGCGRGGPGLWLAREAGVSLTGVDFSPVAIDEATRRAALFGVTPCARFVVGDLTDTTLPDAHSDAAVSIDALHFAAGPAAAAAEARRILRPWLLHGAGFADIGIEERPEWHDLYTRVYRIALDLGDPRDDSMLASLQDEARRRLPLAGLLRRVVVTATAPS